MLQPLLIIIQAEKHHSKWLYIACTLLMLCMQTLKAQDYNIITTDGKLVITDLVGSGDIFTVSQPAANVIRLTTNPVKTYVLNGGGATQNIVNKDFSLVNVTEIIFNTGGGNDGITFGTMTSSAMPSLTVNGGIGDDAVSLSKITFAPDATLDLDMQNDDPSPGMDMCTIVTSGKVLMSGTGSAVIRVSRNVAIQTAASVEAVNGDITIEANQQATPSAGVFHGLEMLDNSKLILTGSGAITVRAKGGNDAVTTASQMGVRMRPGTKITAANSSPVIVEGWGGKGPGSANMGVQVSGNGALITSAGGNVQVTGTGGGAGASYQDIGVAIQFGASVTSGGDAAVTINGTGGVGNGDSEHGVSILGVATVSSANGPVSVSGTAGLSTSSGNYGVKVSSSSGTTATALITSGGGNVEVFGQGGGSGTSFGNAGVYIDQFGRITAGGDGSVKVRGIGAASAGTGNYGVQIVGTGSTITSTNGPVEVKGQGGGAGSAGNQYGVLLLSDGTIAGGGNGTVLVEGTGGGTSGTNNTGVHIQGTNSKVTSSNGNIQITGFGGSANSTGANAGINFAFGGSAQAGGAGSLSVTGTAAVSATAAIGIKAESSGKISAEGTGNVIFDGTGGKSMGNNNYGISVTGTSLITTAGGNISIKGQGGGSETQGSSSNNHGVSMSGGTIKPGGNGVLTVEGKGGNGLSNNNNGVNLQSASLLSSSGGNVNVTGTGGGSGASSNDFGIVVISGGKVSAGGAGNVTMMGTGSPNAGTGNTGVLIQDGNAEVSSSGGNVSITGVENSTSANSTGIVIHLTAIVTTAASGGDIELIANSMNIPSTGTVVTDLNHQVTVRPYSVNMGTEVGSTAHTVGGPLRLSDAEFDRITTGKLIIGNAQSGDVNIFSAISRAAATSMEINSGKSILFNEKIDTNGGNILLHPGDAPAATFPDFTGTDVQLGTGTLSFGNDLAFRIYGPTPGNDFSKYTRLTVNGEVDLAGANLILSGDYELQPGDALVIVDNDGSDAIHNTFNGLAEGAIIADFPTAGKVLKISYVGGDGNDVVLTAYAPCAGYGDHIYVNAAATGENSGKSWENAFVSLQDALAKACSCAAVKEIWVAKGTYYPDQGVAQTDDARESTFRLCNDVAVLGGFAGTEAGPAERNFVLNETILSGDLTQNDGADPALYQENAYHVVSATNVGGTAVLDGFRISGGNANGTAPDNAGGGMYNSGGSPGLNQCIFSGNVAANGGGLYNLSGNPNIVNCLFSGNLANQNGGGIYNFSSSPSLILVTMSGNNALGQGGAMYNENVSAPTISNSVISGNSSGIAPANSDASFSLIQDYPAGANGMLDGTIDPAFENPAGGYATAPFTGGNYRLRTCSPAVNMGDVNAVPDALIIDLGQMPRKQGASVDMGAYENTGFILATAEGTETADLTCQSGDWTYFGASSSGTLTLAIQSPGAGTTVSGELLAAPITLNRPFAQPNNSFHIIRRSWTAHAPEPASPVAVRFFYAPAEVTALPDSPDIEDVVLYKVSGDDAYDTNAQNYTAYTYSSGPATLTTFTTGIFQGLHYVEFLVENFSSGSLAVLADPLPVRLAYFGGTSANGKNLLEWRTEAETGFSHFEIERSADAKNWQYHGRVQGQEGDSGTKYYTYIDSEPFRLSYYRLKMVDVDSTYQNSRIIRVAMDGPAQIRVVYPNPAKTEIRLETLAPGVLRIYNLQGQLIHTQYLNTGLSTVDIRRLAAGMYVASMNGEAIRFEKEAGN